MTDAFGARKSRYQLRREGLTALRTWPPTEGHYEIQDGENWVPVRIAFEASRDPETGEELDRSPQWIAEVNGQPADINDVWPECSWRRISRDQYLRMLPE